MDEAERITLIEEALTQVVADHRLHLVDLEWRALRPRGLLRLYVDKPGGVEIGDCERLSREIGDVLDAAALIEGGYDLEVSSPGLDRQLRKEREYHWAVGRQVRCWLAGGAEVRGRLGRSRPSGWCWTARASVWSLDEPTSRRRGWRRRSPGPARRRISGRLRIS